MKEIGPDELKTFDGKNGHPAYVAHAGQVFDVTASAKWKGGLHMMRHHAGMDLTAEIAAAPHGPEVLERYAQVGLLKAKEAPDETLPAPLARLLARVPFLRRHPHPMTVHFPIAFIIGAATFTLLHLLTGLPALETTAFHCLGVGILFMPVAMTTGYFSWWLNYEARPIRAVIIKQVLSWLLMGLAGAAFLWRLAVPGVVDLAGPAGGLYLVLILALVPLVSVIGWYGATLTFPSEKG